MRSAVWLARHVRDVEVLGSNPSAPTITAMIYIILSDIHSNLEAFEAVEKTFPLKADRKFVCVGDTVGYGANPCECIDKAKQLTDIIVAGNHDWAAAGKFSLSYFNSTAKAAIKWTVKQLGFKEKEALHNLTFVFEDQDLCLVHGTLSAPEKFDYMLDSYTALRSLEMLRPKILFIT